MRETSNHFVQINQLEHSSGCGYIARIYIFSVLLWGQRHTYGKIRQHKYLSGKGHDFFCTRRSLKVILGLSILNGAESSGKELSSPQKIF